MHNLADLIKRKSRSQSNLLHLTSAHKTSYGPSAKSMQQKNTTLLKSDVPLR